MSAYGKSKRSRERERREVEIDGGRARKEEEVGTAFITGRRVRRESLLPRHLTTRGRVMCGCEGEDGGVEGPDQLDEMKRETR